MTKPASHSALIVWLVLAGCSPNPYPGEQGTVLHVAERLIPKGFDPAFCQDEGMGQIQAQVYEGLYIYHPFARPFRLMPAIAESMPKASADHLTMTIPIRRGIRYIDDPCFPDGKGREVTAHDFVYSFLRICHPEVVSPGFWLFDGLIEGVDKWRDRWAGKGKYEGYDDQPSGLRVVDPYTLQIRLTRPYPQLTWVLAMGYAVAYPREAVEYYRDEFQHHPVGTGPFRLLEYRYGFKARFRRNERYRDLRVPGPTADGGFVGEPWPGWERDAEAGLTVNAGKRVPLVDGLEFSVILEAQPRFLYFDSGYLDFLNPPKDNVEDVVRGGELTPEMEAKNIRLQKVPEQGVVYLAMNCEDPLLKNVDLRRAISLALDTRWMIDHLYSKLARHAPCPVPPGNAGHIGSYLPFQTPGGAPDVERAKELLVRAGYPGGFISDPKTGKPILDPKTGQPQRLKINYQLTGTSTTNHEFGDAARRDLRKIGVELVKVPGTFPQALKKMREKNYQLCGLAWGLDYPDAQNVLQLLYGPNEAPGPNSANFKNAEFDALYDQAKVMADSPERTVLYERMCRIVADEVPWVTRTHRLYAALHHSWLTGFKYTKVNYQYWRFLGVDRSERDRVTSEWNRPNYWPPVTFFALLFAGIFSTIMMRKRA